MLDFVNSSWEIIGFIALLINLIAFFEKDDRKMFLLLAICSFFYGMHFYGLGLYTAAFINLLDVSKNLVVMKYKKNLFVFFIYIIAYIIIGGLTADGNIYAYLITIGSILSIYGAFFLRGLNLRIIYFIAAILYLSYNLIGHSIAGSVSSLFFSIELLVSSYILYKRKGIWGKVRYYRYLFYKNLKRFLGHKSGVVFLR